MPLRSEHIAGAFGEIQGMQIFEAGTYRGRNWTEADLDRIVGNFAAHPEIEPPIVLGHDEKQDLLAASGLPSGGTVARLWRSGRKLLADVAEVPAKLVDLINRKAWNRQSAEIYEDFQGDGLALRRVALLGGEIPEVKTLDHVAALYDEEGGRTVVVDGPVERSPITSLAELGDELAGIERRERPRQILDAFQRLAWRAMDAADGTVKERLAALVDELKNVLDHEEFAETGGHRTAEGTEEKPMTEDEKRAFEALAGEVKGLVGKTTEFAEALKARDLKIVELEKRDGHRATAVKVEKVEGAIRRFSEAGTYLPKWTEQGLKGVLLNLPDDEASVAKFAEGDAAKEETPLDAALRIMGTFPRVIDFAERATGGGGTKAGAGQDFMAVAKARSEEKKISMTEAMSQIAREQPDLHHQFKEQAAAQRVEVKRTK